VSRDENNQDAVTPLEILRRDGWCKGTVLNDSGERCLIGALKLSPFAHPWDSRIILIVDEVVREQFPDRIGGYKGRHIADFNDHPDTTFADVELVLEKAQLRFDEQVSPPSFFCGWCVVSPVHENTGAVLADHAPSEDTAS